MSLTISIEIPGLTDLSARAFVRAAEIENAPFEIAWSRPGILRRTPRRPCVLMRDLDSDPSIASETLDHPQGWPDDPMVRIWLGRAFAFLSEHAPDSRFSFHAGWPEQVARERLAVSAEAWLELVNAGRLRTDVRYDVG